MRPAPPISGRAGLSASGCWYGLGSAGAAGVLRDLAMGDFAVLAPPLSPSPSNCKPGHGVLGVHHGPCSRRRKEALRHVPRKRPPALGTQTSRHSSAVGGRGGSSTAPPPLRDRLTADDAQPGARAPEGPARCSTCRQARVKPLYRLWLAMDSTMETGDSDKCF